MGCDGAVIAAASNSAAALSSAAASDAFIPPRVGASAPVPHAANVLAPIKTAASAVADFTLIGICGVNRMLDMCVFFQNDQASIEYWAKKKADPHMQASLNF
jgi:hypothetical protein